jgi:tetratricopeptide (TPR) repeat protein
MSLLADLLSKIKQPQPKREVPPNLQSIVQSSAAKSASRRKTFIILGIVIFIVLAGIIAVYVINSITETSDNGVTQQPLIAQSEETPDIQDGSVKAVKRTDEEQSRQEKKTVPASPVKINKKKLMAKKQKPAIPAADNAIAAFSINANADAPAMAVEEIKEIDIAARDALLYKAREFEMKQDYSSALGTYKEVLEIDRDNVMVLNSIAYIYLKLGLLQESIEYALMAEERDVNYTPALINLGIAYAKSGNAAAAEYYLDRAFKLEPDNKGAIFNLALLNERKQNYSSAAGYFTKLLKLGDTAGTLGLARVYERQGRNTEAIMLYKDSALLESLDKKQRIKIRQRIMVLQNEGKEADGLRTTAPATDTTQ